MSVEEKTLAPIADGFGAIALGLGEVLESMGRRFAPSSTSALPDAYVVPSESSDAAAEISYLEGVKNDLLNENETLMSKSAAEENNAKIGKIDEAIAEISTHLEVSDFDATSFVAPTASYSSKLTLSPSASVWYGANIAGRVSVGERSSVGDGAAVDGSKTAVSIGSDVAVGAASVIRSGATLCDGCVVSAGAVVGEGATIGAGAIVAPGAHIEDGTDVVGGQMWSGNPAAYERDVTADEAASICFSVGRTVRIAGVHRDEWAKHPFDADDELEKRKAHLGRYGEHTADPLLWREPHIDGVHPDDDMYYQTPEKFAKALP